MDNNMCSVPISAHISIDANRNVRSTYEYSQIAATSIADLLIRGFGIDVEEFFDSRNNNPTA